LLEGVKVSNNTLLIDTAALMIAWKLLIDHKAAEDVFRGMINRHILNLFAAMSVNHMPWLYQLAAAGKEAEMATYRVSPLGDDGEVSAVVINDVADSVWRRKTPTSI